MCTVNGFDLPVASLVISVWQCISSPIVKRVKVVLSCGLTPQKLALTLCLGAAFGTIPLVWGASLICIILAHALRLNHLALQSVNFLFWPVHLVLLVPFFKLGAWLFPRGAQLPPDFFATLTRSPGLSTVNILGLLTLKAIAAWMVTVLPAALFTYAILRATVCRKNICRTVPLKLQDQES